MPFIMNEQRVPKAIAAGTSPTMRGLEELPLPRRYQITRILMEGHCNIF